MADFDGTKYVKRQVELSVGLVVEVVVYRAGIVVLVIPHLVKHPVELLRCMFALHRQIGKFHQKDDAFLFTNIGRGVAKCLTGFVFCCSLLTTQVKSGAFFAPSFVDGVSQFGSQSPVSVCFLHDGRAVQRSIEMATFITEQRDG